MIVCHDRSSVMLGDRDMAEAAQQSRLPGAEHDRSSSAAAYAALSDTTSIIRFLLFL